MKRLFLIVLVAILVVGVALAEAKVEFGNWDKWDEELPPADNEAWHWAIKTNEPRVWRLKNFGDSGSDVVLLFSDMYFYGDKKGKTKASVIFYSLGMDVKWDIPNASLALAAFPPDKNEKMIIRAYKKEREKLEFLEEWEIPFEKKEIMVPVVPKDAKFLSELEEWLKSQLSFKSQISSGRTIPQDLIDSMLPVIIIMKGNFMLTNAQPNK